MNPEEIIALKQTVARLVERQITAYVNMLWVGEGTANVQRILIAEDATPTATRRATTSPGKETDEPYHHPGCRNR